MKKITTTETVHKLKLADYIAEAIKSGLYIERVTPNAVTYIWGRKEAVYYEVETVKEE